MMFIMRMGNLAEIDHRQQCEHERLYERNEHAETGQSERYKEMRERRGKISDLNEHLLVRIHVREKSYAERQRSDQVTYQLDHEDKHRYDEHEPRQFRPRQMLQVSP